MLWLAGCGSARSLTANSFNKLGHSVLFRQKTGGVVPAGFRPLSTNAADAKSRLGAVHGAVQDDGQEQAHFSMADWQFFD